jgi:glycosyltransferase involved in cell wall biosynthesis
VEPELKPKQMLTRDQRERSMRTTRKGDRVTEDFPLISIVTPSLNQGAYIEENIKSVLNQHYPNFEHIIIDGGSTDDTIDILMKYNHLIWVSEKDGGQSEAINKGFRRANGEIIGWLNSDDCYAPEVFFTVVKELNKTQGKYILFGDCIVIDEMKNRIGYCKGRLPNPNNLIRYWDRDYTIPQPSVFFFREVLLKCGYLDETFHYAMDYDFWLRISKCYQFHYVKRPLAMMRVHDRSKSNPGEEVFEREWFKVSKKYWGNVFSINYYKYLFMALDYRSNLTRIHAYSKMEELSFKEYQKRILYSIVSNPLNLFKRKSFCALVRTALGHHCVNRIKRV